jgi:hypothetical protein
MGSDPPFRATELLPAEIRPSKDSINPANEVIENHDWTTDKLTDRILL